MEMDPLIDDLGRSTETGAKELIEAAAKIFVAFSGGWLADDREQFLEGLVGMGRKLLAARPSFAPLFHLVTELYARASEPADLVMVRRALRTAAVEFTQSLVTRIEKVARQAADLLGGAGRVLTLGRSHVTELALLAAVRDGSLAAAVIGEGRPGYDGRVLARNLVDAGGINLEVATDISLGGLLDRADLVFIGAESVAARGLAARTGSTMIASAAKAAGKPVYALAGVMTLLPPAAMLPDPCVPRDSAEVWAEPVEGVSVVNVPSEVVPFALLKGVVMENGSISPFEIEKRVKSMPVPPWISE